MSVCSPLRIDRAEEEELVRDDRTADLPAGVALARAGGVHGAVRRLHLRRSSLSRLVRTEVAEQAAARGDCVPLLVTTLTTPPVAWPNSAS